MQTVFLAAGFVLVRSRRAEPVSMVPAFGLGGAVTAVVGGLGALTVGGAWPVVPVAELPAMAALCLVVVPAAFALLIAATRHLPAPEINLLMLLEVGLGPLWTWLAVGEPVPQPTLAGAVLVTATVVGHAVSGPRGRNG